ncbi:MAG TPA: hypothetical protein V6C81_21305 [Planktothrix sp.]|jgi:hypothetical protein
MPAKKKTTDKAEVITLRPDKDPKKLKAIIYATIYFDGSLPLIADQYERLFNEKISHDELKRVLHTHAKRISDERLRLLQENELNPLGSRSGRLMLLAQIYRSANNTTQFMKSGTSWKEAKVPDLAVMLATVQTADRMARAQRQEDRDDDEYDFSGNDGPGNQEIDFDDASGMSDWSQGANDVQDESGMADWG